MLRNANRLTECSRVFTDRELGKRDKKKKEKKLQGFCGVAFVCDLQSRAICDFFADDWWLLPCGT